MIVVGIPAHNEEKTIGTVVESARNFADVVVVCDDGSTDLTAKVASKHGALVERHRNNLGYGRAIASLFLVAERLGATVLVTLDGDSQHDPSSLPSMVRPILRGQADVVIGSRFLSPGAISQIPPARVFAISLVSKLVRLLSGARISDAQCGYRCYGQLAIRLLRPMHRGMGASTEIIFDALRARLRVVEIPVVVRYEGLATSEKNPILHFLEVIFTTLYSAQIANRNQSPQ
jgi:glycosyltransferase involved in cell wall biosynthesis